MENIHFNTRGHFVITEFDITGVECTHLGHEIIITIYLWKAHDFSRFFA